MNKALKKNTFIESIISLTISQIIVKCMGIVYKVYLTNKSGFGDTGNAVFSGAFQIYAMFLTITSIGIPNAISKLVSEKTEIADNNGAYRVLKVALFVFGIIGFICSVIMFLSAKVIANNFLQIPETETSLMILAPAVFFTTIEAVLKGYFNGKRSIEVTAKSQTIEQMMKILFTFIIVEIISYYNKNTELMVAGATLASTLSTIYCSFYLYKILEKNKQDIWKELVASRINKKEKICGIIKKILILVVPIAISGFLSSMTKTIDAFTIVRNLKTVIGDENATLQYGILAGKVETIIAMPFSFNIAISTSLIPNIAGDFIKDRNDSIKKKIEYSYLISFILGTFFTSVIFIFSKEILSILFPNAKSGTEMLKLAVFSVPIVVLMQTTAGIIQGIGKVNKLVISSLVGVIVKLIGNIVMLDRFGIYGAIISTILAQIVSLIMCVKDLKENVKIKINVKNIIIKPLVVICIASIIMNKIYLKINFIKSYGFILPLIIGTTIYSILLLYSKTVDIKEIQSLVFKKIDAKNIKKI